MGCVVLLKETEREREAWKLSILYIANFVTCSGYGKDWAIANHAAPRDPNCIL